MALMVTKPPANAKDMRDIGSILVVKDFLEEGMTTHPVFLSGEYHEQRNLATYSP